VAAVVAVKLRAELRVLVVLAVEARLALLELPTQEAVAVGILAHPATEALVL
jgi:hypothetical protein